MANYIQKISYQGGYYHVYNRGNRKQDIFTENADYIGYLERLRKYKDEHKISIVCYCLMPNHFHILLRQDSEIPICKFIQPLHTSYSMYFNNKYGKVGRLFQGPFKQKEINKDDYLLQASSYIHLNPVVDGLAAKAEDYQWSSYPDYIGARDGTLCDKEVIMAGVSPEKYKRITEEEVKEKLIQKQFQKALN
ncbi:MAG: transposase [Patescibacteria group bacterium]|nr:transposase [Patescibacteria group bacterium]